MWTCRVKNVVMLYVFEICSVNASVSYRVHFRICNHQSQIDLHLWDRNLWLVWLCFRLLSLVLIILCLCKRSTGIKECCSKVQCITVNHTTSTGQSSGAKRIDWPCSRLQYYFGWRCYNRANIRQRICSCCWSKTGEAPHNYLNCFTCYSKFWIHCYLLQYVTFFGVSAIFKLFITTLVCPLNWSNSH